MRGPLFARLDDITRRRLQSMCARLEEIDRLLPLGDADEKDALICEKQGIANELREIGRPPWKTA